MGKARVPARVVIVTALLLSILAPMGRPVTAARSMASTGREAQQLTPDCMVGNPLDQIAPTLRDFGTGGEAYVAQQSTGFRGGEGYRIYSFGFNRGDTDAYTGHP